jgi:hypothetical protein
MGEVKDFSGLYNWEKVEVQVGNQLDASVLKECWLEVRSTK